MSDTLKRIFTPMMAAAAIVIALPASAELIAQEQAAEANQIRVLFTRGSEQGIAQVEQCTACPLKLDIDGQTRFFHNGKEISRNRIDALSGKPGTAIYSLDGKQAHRILW
jgi:hypothetical protein